ncbi:MAG: hypothetical protein AVDCRST_MAG60-2283, partial [uncultured Nocardioides sp.]
DEPRSPRPRPRVHPGRHLLRRVPHRSSPPPDHRPHDRQLAGAGEIPPGRQHRRAAVRRRVGAGVLGDTRRSQRARERAPRGRPPHPDGVAHPAAGSGACRARLCHRLHERHRFARL